LIGLPLKPAGALRKSGFVRVAQGMSRPLRRTDRLSIP
jgi:hypothetical protein